jgi:Zn-dependent protease
MRKPFLVAEDVTVRRSLFRVFGVSWSVTRYAWVSPISWTTLGLVMAFASQSDADIPGLLVAGFGYGVLLYTANILHSVGHIIAGRVVGTPVDVVLATSTRDVIIYRQPGTAASTRCRLGRALGGPAANLVIGCALALAGHLMAVSWILLVGFINVIIAIWTLLPIPSLDGWVIWSILMRSGDGDAA